jgi:hypothetical protein
MNHILPFNQALSIFESNLAEIRLALLDNAQAIISEYSPYAELDVDQPITEEAIIQHVQHLYIQEHVAPLLNTIKRIDSYRYHTDPRNQNNSLVTDLDIENAKGVDKDWFIQEANLCTRKPHVGVCPFHPDKDPSLTLMRSKRTGHFYLKCFPCSKHWDSIGFLMERDGLTFMDAVMKIVC